MTPEGYGQFEISSNEQFRDGGQELGDVFGGEGALAIDEEVGGVEHVYCVELGRRDVARIRLGRIELKGCELCKRTDERFLVDEDGSEGRV